MATILWVQDEFNGPMTGLAEYNNQKVWFSRIDDKRKYNLISLTNELISQLENNHQKYCKETGAPLKHGDSHQIIRTVKQETKENLSLCADENGEVIGSFRGLSVIKRFEHNLPVIDGNIITTINENEFTNYYVPHKIGT